MTVTSKVLGLLLAAGVYQLTPIKQACLRHYRNSTRFQTELRKTGGRGAYLTGVEQGIFGLGCC